MQGERASLGSLSEALNFEHGSTSSNGVIDPQMRWDNALQDYMISSADTNTTFVNSVYHGQHDLNRFSLGDASFNDPQTDVASHDEQRRELGRFEERSNESIDLNPLFVQSSSSNRPPPHNINLNAEFIQHPLDMTQVMGHPGLFDANGPGSRRLSPSRGFETNSSIAGSSLEARRVSCKRKTLEGSIGQSSSSGGFRDFQRGETSSWTTSPPFFNPGNGLNISGSRGDVPSGLISESVPNFTVPAVAESSRRNLSIRINPPVQQETVNPAVFSAGSVVRRPVAPSLSNSSRVLPPDQHHHLDLRHGQALDSQNLNAPTLRMPPISRNMPPPFQWSGGPILGGSSSSSVPPVDRDVIQQGESRWRRTSRNILENPSSVPAPEPRNMGHSQINRNATNGNIPSSSSRTISNVNVQPSPSNPAWSQRRLSHILRRSFLSTLAADGVNHRAGDHPTLRSLVPPASLDELLVQSGGDNSQTHNRTYARAAPWIHRQGEGGVGVPHSLRVLASASRGRSRLVASEIRNVLDLMRRGENLRFEDVMLLDQSAVLGVSDIHDRYRDMRLDVDNMSYEELLALEERIGDVCTGLCEDTILNRLKQQKYESRSKSLPETEPCCICQEEYNEADNMGILDCGHDFHSKCIKEWLKRKNICPICKTTGLNTSDKSTG